MACVGLVSMTLAHALAVTHAMRPRDAACMRAMLGAECELEAFAVNRWQTTGPGWAMVDDKGVLAIGGLSLSTPWSAVLWMVGTARMEAMPPTSQSWRKLVRETRTVVSNALDPSNPIARRRIEANVLGGWDEAGWLIERLGFKYEGTRRAAGSGGEDIEIWARVAERKRTC